MTEVYDKLWCVYNRFWWDGRYEGSVDVLLATIWDFNIS